MGKFLYIIYGLAVVGFTTWKIYSSALEPSEPWFSDSSYHSSGGGGWSYGGSHK